MTTNSIHSVSPTILLDFSERLAAQVVPGLDVPSEETDAVRDAAAGLVRHGSAVAKAEAALRKARLDRDASRQALAEAASALATTLRSCYPPHSAQLAACGLWPMRGSRRVEAPNPPAGLSATLAPGGRLTLRWRRGGNGRTVNFVVEQLLVDGSWASKGVTPYAKLVFDGEDEVPSGFFRVSATRDGALSRPSAVVTPKLAKPKKVAKPARRKAA